MIRGHWQAIRDRWNLHKIIAGKNRLNHLLENVPRYWIAAHDRGGSRIDLGRVTLDQALDKLSAMNERIAYIEREWSFIVLKPREDKDR